MFKKNAPKILAMLAFAITVPLASATPSNVLGWDLDNYRRHMPEPSSMSMLGLDVAAVGLLGAVVRRKFAKK